MDINELLKMVSGFGRMRQQKPKVAENQHSSSICAEEQKAML